MRGGILEAIKTIFVEFRIGDPPGPPKIGRKWPELAAPDPQEQPNSHLEHGADTAKHETLLVTTDDTKFGREVQQGGQFLVNCDT